MFAAPRAAWWRQAEDDGEANPGSRGGAGGRRLTAGDMDGFASPSSSARTTTGTAAMRREPSSDFANSNEHWHEPPSLNDLRQHRRRHPAAAAQAQALLQEYTLSSRAGVALMILAEALLHIPDAAPRDAFAGRAVRHWQDHRAGCRPGALPCLSLRWRSSARRGTAAARSAFLPWPARGSRGPRAARWHRAAGTPRFRQSSCWWSRSRGRGRP